MIDSFCITVFMKEDRLQNEPMLPMIRQPVANFPFFREHISPNIPGKSVIATVSNAAMNNAKNADIHENADNCCKFVIVLSFSKIMA